MHIQNYLFEERKQLAIMG